ncbi:amyloid-beta A4 precursor protein-binding family A member 3-like isoform X2 [Phyllobates terribilis]|uniref:amyloid-beta A4 precursor protein-binding family A member 3-like isoform X2 n=1 Tax=Phyllobates terribilis TaxID=111132 RepID=UPI003CCB4F2C
MQNYGMELQGPKPPLPSYLSGTLPEGPPMDLETAGQGSGGNPSRAPPRVDSCPGMDTRPPPELKGMECQLGTTAHQTAFHMMGLLSELPTFTRPSNGNDCVEETCLGNGIHKCPPCLLHIAMGKGLAHTLRQMSESNMDAAGSHGLLLTENDKDGMFTLFQCEEGTLSAGDTGTPLARLEAISGKEQCTGALTLEEKESPSVSSGLSREDSSCSLAEQEPQLCQRHIQEILPQSQNYPAPPKVPGPCDPEDLLDGVVFGAKYLGSTQLQCERHQMASTRMRQAQEAVSRVKAPDGESQPMTEVDVMVSTQHVKVLTTDIQAQLIAHAIGQAFGLAYQNFLRSEGVEPEQQENTRVKEQLYNADLAHFTKKENIREVYIQKERGEMLGVAVVESGWGSLLPTVVLANLMHGGPAERSGELSIGDHLTSLNSTSLVGLPFSTCQGLIRELKSQSQVVLSIVRCPPVVTAIIQRPDTTYQLGFCVEDGVICSLVRGGIAERGGIRVGHQIIEINGQSVVATAHEKIIHTLLDATGEVHIKTMPASTYRLLTGQESPVYL